MQTSTATVETLTASVRVLQAGSRQVTQSVFWQLDEVECDDIEAFGRVSPKMRERDIGDFWLVGAHRVTGDLVRAWFSWPDEATLRWYLGLPLIVLAGLR